EGAGRAVKRAHPANPIRTSRFRTASSAVLLCIVVPPWLTMPMSVNLYARIQPDAEACNGLSDSLVQQQVTFLAMTACSLPLRLRRQRAPSLTGARSPRLRRRRGHGLTCPLPSGRGLG